MKMWALKSQEPVTAPHTGTFVFAVCRTARFESSEDLKSNGFDGLKFIQNGVLSSDWMKLEMMGLEPMRLVPYSVSCPFFVWMLTERPLTMGIVFFWGGGGCGAAGMT